ncbi:MAG: phosphate signaling complex protein PhoU [Planctomycetes bacterium]|jgi:phosphate transport system protein|nr:phosphate signaling complex protein PhoU [Planctomycetota bacterium]
MKGQVVDKHGRRLDKELDDLKKKLLHMASIAETMIDKTVSELVERDEKIADPVPEYEEELNRLQIDIDEEAIMLLATQQPVAGDLRFIITASKINSELERIGDLTINITENVHTLLEEPPLKPLIDIPRMADLARQMVRDSLDSLVKEDVLLAQSVISADDQVDGLKDQVVRELVTYMIGDPRAIERALALILIARHVERIADHATNIAQDVIYLIQGRDVRHPRIARDKE